MSTRCANCGAPVKSDTKFCSDCGKPIAQPQPVTAQAVMCPYCGSSIPVDSRFCEKCGRSLQQPASPGTSAGFGAPSQPGGSASAPVIPPVHLPIPPPSYKPVPPLYTPPPQAPIQPPPAFPTPPPNVTRPPAPPSDYGLVPPPPGFTPPPGAGSRGGVTPPVYVSGSSSLPPAPIPWSWQNQLAASAGSFARSMGSGRLGVILSRMIRATFLDQASYREAAEDTAGTLDAGLVLGLVLLVATLGSYMMGLRFWTNYLLAIIVLTVLQIVSIVVATAAVAWATKPVAGVQLSFGQVFRPLAYAQSAGILGIIAPLAIVFGLWRLVTSLAAIRAITGCDTGKAAVMLLVGFVVAFIIGLLSSPILMSLGAVYY